MLSGCSTCVRNDPDDRSCILQLLQYRHTDCICCRGHTYGRACDSFPAGSPGRSRKRRNRNTSRGSCSAASSGRAPEEVPTEAVAANFNLDEQEYQVLLRIVEAEAGGEDTVGKMLVANVIMNRVNSGIFPATVTGVVYQNTECGAQFAPTVDGRIDRVSVSQDTTEAVNRVLGGEDVSQGALFFRSTRSRSSWFDQSLNRVLEHGNHIFYTL